MGFQFSQPVLEWDRIWYQNPRPNEHQLSNELVSLQKLAPTEEAPRALGKSLRRMEVRQDFELELDATRPKLYH